MKVCCFLSLFLTSTAVFAQDTAQSEVRLDLLAGEVWWGGAVTLGAKMPYGAMPIEINLDGDNRGNQYAPLLISSKGRYVWCEKAFRFAFKDNALQVTSLGNTIRYGRAGQSLRDSATSNGNSTPSDRQVFLSKQIRPQSSRPGTLAG